jgi:hypothetical protein
MIPMVKWIQNKKMMLMLLHASSHPTPPLKNPRNPVNPVNPDSKL